MAKLTMDVRCAVLLAAFVSVATVGGSFLHDKYPALVCRDNETHVVADHEGGNATLRCSLPVSDPPNIEWLKGSLRFPGYDMIYNSSDGHINEKGSGFSDRFYVDNKDPRTLYIDVIMNVAYVYICRSQLSNGTVLQEHIHLDVVYDLDCSSWKVNNTWTEGDEGSLTCAVSVYRQKSPFGSTAKHEPKVTLYREDSDDAIGEVTDWPPSETTVGVTHRFKVKKTDDGLTFICRMTYLHYESQCSLTLHVSGGGSTHVVVGMVFLSVPFALFGSQ